MSLLHSQPAPLPTPSHVDSLTDDEFEDVDADDDLSLHGLDDEPDFSSSYQPGIDVCIVCRNRPPYSNGGRKYPTCGLTCAEMLDAALNQHTPPPPAPRSGGYSSSSGSHRGRGGAPSTSSRTSRNPSQRMPGAYAPQQYNAPQYSQQQYIPQSHYIPQPHYYPRDYHAPAGRPRVQYAPPQPSRPCVVCKTSPCYGKQVTCGAKCTEKLFTNGPPDATKCDYCHRRPKVSGHNQCGNTCKASAEVACLLCKSRPKHKNYHLCGKTCKQISVKATPLLLEVPPGHVSHTMVQNKFKKAGGTSAIKHIYKIIENKSFLQPYDAYKRRVGNEVFRYHGTKRGCTLGANGNTKLCSGTCALCSILRTSFKTSLAATWSFGGVYSSSSPVTASGYMGSTGAMILTKVVLGKIWDVGQGSIVKPPAGYDSVVYNPVTGNETIVFTDDAIRPVFLIIF